MGDSTVWNDFDTEVGILFDSTHAKENGIGLLEASVRTRNIELKTSTLQNWLDGSSENWD
ncbi:MAG: hypothetical protein M2R45_01474 [Verrucomicrobia subdivision 3 bacterium]|nr:hypothetical protein [Limisphaerales bacterium]MCS1413396.1 hypothetical protein [Limisphaerales bacterium]